MNRLAEKISQSWNTSSAFSVLMIVVIPKLILYQPDRMDALWVAEILAWLIALSFPLSLLSFLTRKKEVIGLSLWVSFSVYNFGLPYSVKTLRSHAYFG